MATIPSIADLYGGDPMLTDGVPTPNNVVGTPKSGKLVARHEKSHALDCSPAPHARFANYA